MDGGEKLTSMYKLIYKILFLLVSVTILSCNKQKVAIKTTEEKSCIMKLIEERNQTDNCLDKVSKYQYKGETVYLFTSDCPDYFQDLYNEKCILICRPSGGLSGNGDGKCKDFYTEATEEELIWQK